VLLNKLYQFAAKVEGKMYGRGIFISINVFSNDSVRVLTIGKALNTILVDGGDLVLATEGLYTVGEMLNNKIKAAQTMGRICVDSINLMNKNIDV
jgi:transketolase C-terminal domain/subunit